MQLETLKDFKRRVIKERLAKKNFNVTHTAKSLDITISTLQSQIRYMGLKHIIKEYRAGKYKGNYKS